MHPFWHFDAQGIATILSIVVSAATIAVGISRGLRRILQAMNMTLWEHRVMWLHWTKINPVPEYPKLEIEKRSNGAASV